MEYHIDHHGTDGRWRVWWIGPTGYIHELLFDSAQDARDWVDEMRSLDAAD